LVQSYLSISDCELTASELRLKYESIKSLNQLQMPESSSSSTSSSSKGTQVNVATSTTTTTSLKKKSNPQSPIYSTPSPSISEEIAAMSSIIDTDLFSGLTLLLTEDEQRYISQLMTSGDTDKVAQGVQLLASISEFSRQQLHHGVSPSVKASTSSTGTHGGVSTRVNSQHYSSSTAHRSTTTYTSRYPSTATKSLRTGWSSTAKKPTTATSTVAARAIAMSQSAEEKLQAAAERRAKEHWKRNPLPRRMPKSVTLDIITTTTISNKRNNNNNNNNNSGTQLTVSLPLLFTDDEWDGTIADAFRRVQIDRRTNQVMKAVEKTKQRWGKTSKTISTNIYGDEEKHIQTPEICEGYTGPTQRVIVASVKGQAAKKGIQVGDVVTHVNGERLEGSAADLLRHIQYFAERGDDTLTLVFNAEPAIATALSKRAFSLDNLSF